MAGKSFYEILERQIRADLREDIRKEVEAELRSELTKGQAATTGSPSDGLHERVECWLASHVNKMFFHQGAAAQRVYKSQNPSRPERKVEPEKKPAHQEPALRLEFTRIEDLCALELIRRHSGVALGSCLSASELKAAWRKAALRTHPDRFTQEDALTQAQMGAVFNELVEAYDQLSCQFNKQSENQKSAA